MILFDKRSSAQYSHSAGRIQPAVSAKLYQLAEIGKTFNAGSVAFRYHPRYAVTGEQYDGFGRRPPEVRR